MSADRDTPPAVLRRLRALEDARDAALARWVAAGLLVGALLAVLVLALAIEGAYALATGHPL